MKKTFVISALAITSLNSFGNEIYDVQRNALDRTFQSSTTSMHCEYLQLSWWGDSVKATYLIDLDLKSKTFLVTIKDSTGKVKSKKTYKIAVWKKDDRNNIVINALTTDTEVPEVRVADLNVKTKKMELYLEYINGKYEVASIQCK